MKYEPPIQANDDFCSEGFMVFDNILNVTEGDVIQWTEIGWYPCGVTLRDHDNAVQKYRNPSAAFMVVECGIDVSIYPSGMFCQSDPEKINKNGFVILYKMHDFVFGDLPQNVA